jgi:hypothetical protein
MNFQIYLCKYIKEGVTMIEKFEHLCCCVKTFVIDGSYSVYEIVCKLVEYVNNLVDTINTTVGELVSAIAELDDTKEDKDNLTNVRKLSEDGDFTGSLCSKYLRGMSRFLAT